MHAAPPLHVAPLVAGALAAAWSEWVAGEAVQGADLADVVACLVQSGLDPQRAGAETAAILGALAMARRADASAAAMERAARVLREVASPALPEVTQLSENDLYDVYWTAHRPVVLRGGASRWPAAAWTFAELRSRFAWAPVDVSVRSPEWWLKDRRTQRMAFGALVDAALGPPSDALYADGRSDLLEQAGLAALRSELGILPGLVGDGSPRAWLGPAGTVTPTHHDQSTAWQVLLLGRKRVHLASPLEASLVAPAVGVFNRVDPHGDARFRVVELGPGDALFVPAGWWHHVEALAPSISVSMSLFRWPNAFPWLVGPT